MTSYRYYPKILYRYIFKLFWCFFNIFLDYYDNNKVYIFYMIWHDLTLYFINYFCYLYLYWILCFYIILSSLNLISKIYMMIILLVWILVVCGDIIGIIGVDERCWSIFILNNRWILYMFKYMMMTRSTYMAYIIIFKGQ
jgi:hypothetical protein